MTTTLSELGTHIRNNMSPCAANTTAVSHNKTCSTFCLLMVRLIMHYLVKEAQDSVEILLGNVEGGRGPPTLWLIPQ